MGHSSSLSLFENTLGQQQVYGKKLMDWSMIKATFLNNDQYHHRVDSKYIRGLRIGAQKDRYQLLLRMAMISPVMSYNYRMCVLPML